MSWATRKLLQGVGGEGGTEADFPNPPLLVRRAGRAGALPAVLEGVPYLPCRGGGGARPQHLRLKVIPMPR